VNVVRLAELRAAPFSVDEVREAASDPTAGAIVLFIGTVRDHDHGRAVTALSYSAHPSAEAELTRVAEKIAAGYELMSIAVLHRTGDLRIGDVAVVAAAAAAHRGTAFAACEALIDELKATVPIWKHQLFSGGDSEWVNSA
jgi:molybdopterin synthase catalytic subunit